MEQRVWWEDLTVGRVFDLGSCVVDRNEVIDFARRFDPQPFHIDDEAAAANPIFGRLSASGVHTFALSSRMTYDGFSRIGLRTLGGAGLDELRFTRGVFPGDTLTTRMEVMAARALSSHPDRGVATLKTEVINQHGDVVMHHHGAIFFQRRPAAA